MVEHQIVVLAVAGSNPVDRPNFKGVHTGDIGHSVINEKSLQSFLMGYSSVG